MRPPPSLLCATRVPSPLWLVPDNSTSLSQRDQLQLLRTLSPDADTRLPLALADNAARIPVRAATFRIGPPNRLLRCGPFLLLRDGPLPAPPGPPPNSVVLCGTSPGTTFLHQ